MEKSMYTCHLCGDPLYLLMTPEENKHMLEYACTNQKCSRCHRDYKVIAINEQLEQETINTIKSKLDGDPENDHSNFDNQLIIFLQKAGYIKLAELWHELSGDFWYA